MTGFFVELQRRKVYRVAAAYIVAAGFIIQIGSAVFPAWELPNWAFRLLVVVILAGFPLALIFAWIFDLTPAGIERTSKVVPQIQSNSHRRRNLILLAMGGIVLAAAAGFFVLPRASAHRVDKSIAVLPFENFSDDKENAYFADGIQDDILTNLSKIGDLKVISRTSVMGYRGKSQNTREIGKALGVSNILEGSVRRAGNQVRINVQLIDTTSDQHVWAEDYDGDLSDVFKIQSDLAMKIASALQAKLSPTEKEHMARKPTENGDAYLAFVRAHDLHSSSYEDMPKLKEGEQMYEKALQLDPNFALAAARYSQLESWIVHSFDPSAARRDKARALAVRAVQLQPELPEAHLSLGFVYYYLDNNFEAAAREFAIAHEGLPNDSEVYLALGAIERRQGKWAESNASLAKAVSLNPKDTWAMQNLAINYEMQRNWEAGNRTLDRALAVDPKAFSLRELKAKFAIEARGDFSIADKFLAEIPKMNLTPEVVMKIAGEQIQLSLLLRKYDDAIREAAILDDNQLRTFPGGCFGKYTTLGVAKRAAGDERGARAMFEKSKQFAEEDLKQAPEDGNAHARLAQALAWLGQKEAAFAEIKRAQELLPESKDAFDGPAITATLAEIHAIFGESSNAVAILEGLLQRPSSVTVALLKLNPIWDPIRQDAGFQKLVQTGA
jgi:TolB-like protein/cytochrome c-type biogenesis protein CcmH/NrfG